MNGKMLRNLLLILPLAGLMLIGVEYVSERLFSEARSGPSPGYQLSCTASRCFALGPDGTVYSITGANFVRLGNLSTARPLAQRQERQPAPALTAKAQRKRGILDSAMERAKQRKR